MRIAELINNLEIGGAERMVVDLARGLSERDHQVTVACLRDVGPLSRVLKESGIPVIALKKGAGFQIEVVRALARYLREAKIDVIHTHNPIVHHYGVLAGKLAGVSTIVNTLHGPGNLSGLGGKEILFELSCLFSTCVVACCNAVHEHLRTVCKVASRQSAVVRNGIELDRFIGIPPLPADNKFVFGMVGRLVPVKDHRSLLEAFSKVSRVAPHCRLEILGDGPLRAELEAAVTDLDIRDAVTFHGSSLDVATFLQKLNAFVLCSVSEGLPLTVLEAMAAARPVIGTAVGAIPELVMSSGCGWVAPSKNPEALAKAMLEAISCQNLEERGNMGREYVIRHYSVQDMVSGYESLFERLQNKNEVCVG